MSGVAFFLVCPSPLPLGAAALSTPVSCIQLSALLFSLRSSNLRQPDLANEVASLCLFACACSRVGTSLPHNLFSGPLNLAGCCLQRHSDLNLGPSREAPLWRSPLPMLQRPSTHLTMVQTSKVLPPSLPAAFPPRGHSCCRGALLSALTGLQDADFRYVSDPSQTATLIGFVRAKLPAGRDPP